MSDHLRRSWGDQTPGKPSVDSTWWLRIPHRGHPHAPKKTMALVLPSGDSASLDNARVPDDRGSSNGKTVCGRSTRGIARQMLDPTQVTPSFAPGLTAGSRGPDDSRDWRLQSRDRRGLVPEREDGETACEQCQTTGCPQPNGPRADVRRGDARASGGCLPFPRRQQSRDRGVIMIALLFVMNWWIAP